MFPHICVGKYAKAHMWRSEDSRRKLFLAFPPWGSWEPNKIIGLDLKKKPCLFIVPSCWSTVLSSKLCL